MSAFHFLRLFKHGAQMSPFFIQAMIQAWIEHKSTNEGRRPWLQVACNVAASPMLDENCPVWTEGCLTAQPFTESPLYLLPLIASPHTSRGSDRSHGASTAVLLHCADGAFLRTKPVLPTSPQTAGAINQQN